MTAGIDELLGIAVGCIGMSVEDFCRCTPSEFKAVSDAWSRHREQLERGRWERVRMTCLCSLQPYSKKRLSAEDIMEFPWERKPESPREELSKEEELARYGAAKRAYGLK